MLLRAAQAARRSSTQEGDDQVEAKEVGHWHCRRANAKLMISVYKPINPRQTIPWPRASSLSDFVPSTLIRSSLDVVCYILISDTRYPSLCKQECTIHFHFHQITKHQTPNPNHNPERRCKQMIPHTVLFKWWRKGSR